MSADKVVLVVDDDHAVLETMQLLLEGHGFQVHGALGALGAMAFLTSDAPLDVIVADLILSGETSGTQLCEMVRRSYPRVGVVIISAEPAGAAANAIASSVYLRKPFGGNELIKAIEQAMDVGEEKLLDMRG